MANLKMTTKTTHHVNYSDLERFIKELYFIDYEIVAAEEASNGDNLHFVVDGKIAEYELDKMRNIISGKWVPFSTGILLNLMCANEEIPAGEYYIEISG